MSQFRHALLLPVLILAAACEQESQKLPFDAGDSPVEQTVTSNGGSISSVAGASVHFPSGSVSGDVVVKMTPTANTESVSGTPASDNAFELAPAGLELGQPAAVELKLSGAARTSQDAWLASVVNTVPAGVIEGSAADLDLSSGLARAEINHLGKIALVVPAPSAIVNVTRSLTTVARTDRAPTTALPTRALSAQCGVPTFRCQGLELRVSDNVMDLVNGRAAILFPRVSGALEVSPLAVRGAIQVMAGLRVQVSSKVVSTVPVEITLEGTDNAWSEEGNSAITLHGMRVRIRATKDEHTTTIKSITLQKDGDTAWFVAERTFKLQGENGASEDASASIRIPLVRQF